MRRLHNHRFCTVTGEAIYHNEHDHFHEVKFRTDFSDEHFHEFCGKTSGAIDVGNGKHVHFIKDFTEEEDNHKHNFRLQRLSTVLSTSSANSLWIPRNYSGVFRISHDLPLFFFASRASCWPACTARSSSKAAIRLYLLNRSIARMYFIRSKGSETEISLAAWPEPGARRSYHIGPFQQIVKEFPGSHPFRRLQPDIRRVHAS